MYMTYITPNPGEDPKLKTLTFPNVDVSKRGRFQTWTFPNVDVSKRGRFQT